MPVSRRYSRPDSASTGIAAVHRNLDYHVFAYRMADVRSDPQHLDPGAQHHRRAGRPDRGHARARGVSGPVGKHPLAPRGSRSRPDRAWRDAGADPRLPTRGHGRRVTETPALMFDAAADLSDVKVLMILRVWRSRAPAPANCDSMRFQYSPPQRGGASPWRPPRVPRGRRAGGRAAAAIDDQFACHRR